MKEYIKPTVTLIELRTDERLACCGVNYGKHHKRRWGWFDFWDSHEEDYTSTASES
jgi:hypothetical protein